MKVLLTQAPFVMVNEEFKTCTYTLWDRIKRLINYYTEWNLPKKDIRFGVRAGSRYPFTSLYHGYKPFPFMLAYSASLIKSKGFEVDLIDSVCLDIFNYEYYLKKVKKTKPDIVIMESATITIENDLKLLKKISKFAEVALACPQMTDEEAIEVQKKAPYVKYILKGEYILSSLKAVQTRKAGIYDSEIVEDLDSIPFPYRDFEWADKYFDGSLEIAKPPQLQIYGGKGCPFKCIYCMWPQTMYKGKVSLRSPKKIAEEIKESLKTCDYKNIFFDDDTFNLGTERISELCDYLKEIGIPWTMMGRLDCSPNWLYDKMVESGCVGMRFGVETFNIDILKRINKGLERVDFKDTIKYLTEKYPDLHIHLTLMKDLPGQTEEIHEEDVRIMYELGYQHDIGQHTYQQSTCAPFKGTALYKELVETFGQEYIDANMEIDRESYWDKNKNENFSLRS